MVAPYERKSWLLRIDDEGVRHARHFYRPGVKGYASAVASSAMWEFGVQHGPKGMEWFGYNPNQGFKNSAWARDFGKIAAAKGGAETFGAIAGGLINGGVRLLPAYFALSRVSEGYDEGGVYGAMLGAGAYARDALLFSPVAAGS